MRRLLLALALPLAACASTGEYPGAPPAPIAPVAAPRAAPVLEMPAEPFIVTAPGPAGAFTPYHVVPMPMGPIVTPGVFTTGPYKPLMPN